MNDAFPCTALIALFSVLCSAAVEAETTDDEQTLRHFKTVLWPRACRTRDMARHTAIIDGTGVAAQYSYRSSNVLIKEDGRWRAVASHVSGYREH